MLAFSSLSAQKMVTTANFEITYEVKSDCENDSYVPNEYVGYNERLEFILLHFEEMSKDHHAHSEFEETVYRFYIKRENPIPSTNKKFKIDYEILEDCDGYRTVFTETEFEDSMPLSDRMNLILLAYQIEMIPKEFKDILRKFMPVKRV